MLMTIDLPPYVETYLREEAARQETPVEEYTARLVEGFVPKPQFKTGADVIAYYEREGILGMWADREDMQDSTAYVNRLREKIEEEFLAKQRIPVAKK